MRIVDKVVLTLFFWVILLMEPGIGILISLFIGMIIANIIVKLSEVPFIGNLFLIIIALIWVGAFAIAAEFLTYNSETGVGLVTTMRREQPVITSAIAIAAMAFSTWLQFRFAKEHRYGERRLWEKILSLFGNVRYHSNYGRTRYDTYEAPRSANTRYEEPIPTYEDFLREFDSYHAAFDRVSLLVNDITESPEFMMGGFMTFDKINEVMSFIQDHNAHVEALSRRFRSADAAEAREIIGDMRYINRRMNAFEQELRSVYAQMKARFAGASGSAGGSQRQSTGSSTRFTSRGEQSVYFKDCQTLEELNKRYKSLAKQYHPDMPTGDTEIMAKINQEYDRLKTRFK